MRSTTPSIAIPPGCDDDTLFEFIILDKNITEQPTQEPTEEPI